jgi:hypothetical protein
MRALPNHLYSYKKKKSPKRYYIKATDTKKSFHKITYSKKSNECARSVHPTVQRVSQKNPKCPKGHAALNFLTSNRRNPPHPLPHLTQESFHATSHPDYSHQSSPQFSPSASPTPAAPYPKSTHHTVTSGSSRSSSGQEQQRRCRTLSESTAARRPTRGGSGIAEEPG